MFPPFFRQKMAKGTSSHRFLDFRPVGPTIIGPTELAVPKWWLNSGPASDRLAARSKLLMLDWEALRDWRFKGPFFEVEVSKHKKKKRPGRPGHGTCL